MLINKRTNLKNSIMKKVIILLLIFYSFLFQNIYAQGLTVKDITTGYINCLDSKIYYEEVGTGEAMVLAHGGYLDSRMWDEQFLYFANQGYRVIRFDSYAHGKTIDGVNTPFLHEIVQSLLDSLSIKKANLVGLSMGGVTLIEFALECPQYINKMVLVSTGINGYKWEKDKLFILNLRKQIEYINNQDTLNAAEMFLKSWTDGPYRDPEDVPAAIRLKNKQMILERFKNHGLRKNALRSRPKATKRYKSINCPVLIILGEKDMASIHDISNMLKDGIENSKMETIKGSAHMVNMEYPERFNSLVLEYLNNIETIE
jgi:3-oxoadipate enol-lactonase